jgi:hypothetical protein
MPLNISPPAALADALPVRVPDRALEAVRAFVADVTRHLPALAHGGALVTTHAQVAVATGRSVRTVERLIPAAVALGLMTYAAGRPQVGTYGRRSGRLTVHASAVRAWAVELREMAGAAVSGVTARAQRGREAAARLIRNPDAFVASLLHHRRKPTRHGGGSPPGVGGRALSTGVGTRVPRPWENLTTCQHDSLLGQCGTCRRFQATLLDQSNDQLKPDALRARP